MEEGGVGHPPVGLSQGRTYDDGAPRALEARDVSEAAFIGELIIHLIISRASIWH